jgi:hypothetical protein
LAILDLDADTLTNNVEPISSDPAVKVSGGNVYIINRYLFDNIQVLDIYDEFTTKIQFTTGNGSNPQDIEWIDVDKVYVSRFEPPFNDILIADPNTGEEIGSIDLTNVATNKDGTPRAAKMTRVGDYVFCCCQNINASFTAYGAGKVAVIDTNTDTLVKPQGIKLELKNPTSITYDENLNKVFVGCSGDFFDAVLTSGVEVIDPDSLTSDGVLLKASDLDGALAFDIEIVNVNKGYIIVNDPNFVNSDRCYAFEPKTGGIYETIVANSENPFEFTQMAKDSEGFLYLLQFSLTSPRVFKIDTFVDQIVDEWMPRLPPVAIDIIELN